MKTLITKSSFMFSLMMFAAGSLCASDDFQYWSRLTLKTWEQKPYSLSTYFDMRLMDDAADPRLYLISEQLAYRWSENLNLGLNYTYLESETRLASGEEIFKYQHRMELEANPHWKPVDWLRIKNRNRVEFRWIEDQGSDNARFRHRWEIEFPLKDKSPLQAFFANNEFFYDFNKGEYSENRAIPLGIKLAISEKASVQVFYMIQSRKGVDDWSSNQIVGTHITVTF